MNLVNRLSSALGVSGSPDYAIPDKSKSLEEKMEFLRYWGDCSVSFIKDGWHCRVEMNVNATGVQFKVASEFNHKTPGIAADTCIERMVTALKTLGVDAYKTMS